MGESPEAFDGGVMLLGSIKGVFSDAIMVEDEEDCREAGGGGGGGGKLLK